VEGINKGALSGIKVVEYGDFISAPFCGKLLADFGAEVIKVEPCHRGDSSRHYGPFPQNIPDPERSGLFLYLNSNKLGVTLNLEDKKGAEILRELIGRADCFIENQPRKDIERLNLSYEALKKLNRKLVVTSISIFGRTGPYKDYKGQHINCCALSGASQALGFPDREPLSVPLFYYDYQAGLNACAATITALIARFDPEIDEGQHIDISESDVAVNNIGIISLLYEVFLQIPLKREGRRAPGSLGVYPCGTYRCKNGYVTATSRTKKEWVRFLDAMGNPEWSENPRYQDPIAISKYPDEVDKFFEPWLMEHTKDEILQIARKNRIAIAPIRTIDELMTDPHFKERNSFISVDIKDGKQIQLPTTPYRFSRTPCRLPGAAPKLGEYNEEVYCRHLGYKKKDLVTLRRSGVI
jgi:crotonobetainyl-CoA:carnitine CoA-transferase CaiB-like acyl-CoA transferase